MPPLFHTLKPLILASGSPRRRDMLDSLGISFRVETGNIVEAIRGNESPEAHVSRLAVDKTAAVSARVPGGFVLAADTVVVIDGEILGKPEGAAGAAAMLSRLSGRTHEVWTGFSLTGGDEAVIRAVMTRVDFVELSPEIIDAYVGSGDPMDKAGAYGIQGPAAAFVREIRGSYTNVVGLPLAEVVGAMLAAGVIRAVFL